MGVEVSTARINGGCGLALGLVLAACGMSSNRTATKTLPFHAELDDLVGSQAASVATRTPLTAGGPITIAPFVPYYARPTGFVVFDSSPTTWSELDAGAPEVALAETWRRALVAGSGAGVTVRGVVTDFEWYQVGGVMAGRIVSLLVVVGADGTVVFEREHATQRRAQSPAALINEHVHEWTRDAGFRRAIGAAP